MFSGRLTFADPDLGNCTVYRGRPAISAVLAGVGLAIFVLFGYASLSRGLPLSSTVAILVMLPGLFAVLAMANWRTELYVGERGFRWEKPWRPLQVPLQVLWSEVASCDLGTQSDRRGTKAWLVVRLSDGEKIEVTQQFSATWWEIRDLMEERRKGSVPPNG
jgi:hypothetical protein